MFLFFYTNKCSYFFTRTNVLNFLEHKCSYFLTRTNVLIFLHDKCSYFLIICYQRECTNTLLFLFGKTYPFSLIMSHFAKYLIDTHWYPHSFYLYKLLRKRFSIFRNFCCLHFFVVIIKLIADSTCFLYPVIFFIFIRAPWHLALPN